MLAKVACRTSPAQLLRPWRSGRRRTHDDAAAGELDPSKIPRIPTRELRVAAMAAGIPAIFFGFADNFIMLVAGEELDEAFLKVGMSTMAAAAWGNLVSDVIGTRSEGFVDRNIRIPVPQVSEAQRTLRSFKAASNWGKVVGISLGCMLGMVPLIVTLPPSVRQQVDQLKRMVGMVPLVDQAVRVRAERRSKVCEVLAGEAPSLGATSASVYFTRPKGEDDAEDDAVIAAETADLASSTSSSSSSDAAAVPSSAVSLRTLANVTGATLHSPAVIAHRHAAQAAQAAHGPTTVRDLLDRAAVECIRSRAPVSHSVEVSADSGQLRSSPLSWTLAPHQTALPQHHHHHPSPAPAAQTSASATSAPDLVTPILQWAFGTPDEPSKPSSTSPTPTTSPSSTEAAVRATRVHYLVLPILTEQAECLGAVCMTAVATSAETLPARRLEDVLPMLRTLRGWESGSHVRVGRDGLEVEGRFLPLAEGVVSGGVAGMVGGMDAEDVDVDALPTVSTLRGRSWVLHAQVQVRTAQRVQDMGVSGERAFRCVPWWDHLAGAWDEALLARTVAALGNVAFAAKAIRDVQHVKEDLVDGAGFDVAAAFRVLHTNEAVSRAARAGDVAPADLAPHQHHTHTHALDAAPAKWKVRVDVRQPETEQPNRA